MKNNDLIDVQYGERKHIGQGHVAVAHPGSVVYVTAGGAAVAMKGSVVFVEAGGQVRPEDDSLVFLLEMISHTGKKK